MAKNKYGYDRLTDPDYWVKTSRAIWRDRKMSLDTKMKAQEKVFKEYQKGKRKKKPEGDDLPTIRKKLGLSQRASRGEVIRMLNRLKNKSLATWKALKLNKEETLKKFGIT